jgi:predicted GNAT family acetyltransferase
MDITIRHDPEHRQFVADVDGHEAVVQYRETEQGTFDLFRTFTPEALRGRGIAGRLVEATLEHARANGWKIVPTCPYVTRYVERHPEHRDLVAD